MISQVLVVEDEPELLLKFATVVQSDPMLVLSGAVPTGKAGIALLDALRPDVLMVDLGLPDISGIEVIAHAAKHHPATDVLVVTMFGDDKHVLASIEAGATGYLLKDALADRICISIHELRAGGSPITPSIARKVLARFRLPLPRLAAAKQTALEPGPVNITITVPSTITAVADTVTLTPSSTLNLLANDSLNGGPPISAQVTVTFNTASAFLSQTGGLLTLAAGTPGGSTQTATYSLCVALANTTCSSTVGVTITAPITAVANPDGPLILTRGIGAGVSLYANDTLNGVLVPPGAVNVQYTLNDNTVTFTLTPGGYLQLVNDMFASPGIYTLSYTFCEAGVASNCSTTSATINVQAP